MAFEPLEPHYGARAKIGLLVPSPNTVAESEFWRAAPSGVSIHTSRMPFFAGSSADPFADMEAQVPRVIAEACTADPTVIAYGCTASSAVAEPVAKETRLATAANRQTVTAAASILAALARVGASRIVLLTPYPQAINDKERRFFAANGVAVLADESIIVDEAQLQLRNMYRVPVDLLVERAVALCGALSDAGEVPEAVVLSCCDMPTLDAIEPIERATGKFVTSSNQALLWRSLRSAGVEERISGFGSLLTTV